MSLAVAWLVLVSTSPAEAVSWEFGGCPLPSALAHLGALDDDSLGFELRAYRRRQPNLFATSAPPGPLRASADFEPKEAVHVVFPVWREGQPAAANLIAEALPHGRVVVHVMFDGQASDVVEALGPWPGAAERVEIRDDRVSSVWIRDFGGIWGWSSGERVLFDGRYFVDCIEEDAWPTRFGAAVGASVHRTDLPLEGGNFLSDGEGTCFTTTAFAGRAELPPRTIAAELGRWLGCRRVVQLAALDGDETEHIDVMLSLADPRTLLLAEADPVSDPINHHRLERLARRLRQLRASDGSRYRIFRVPLAPPTIHPETGEDVLRSYLNLLPFNGVVLVPTYAGAGAIEARAFAVIEAAFEGWRVVGVPADEYVADGGAVHCVTWTVPALPGDSGQNASPPRRLGIPAPVLVVPGG